MLVIVCLKLGLFSVREGGVAVLLQRRSTLAEATRVGIFLQIPIAECNCVERRLQALLSR
jgi:hypothetical protein